MALNGLDADCAVSDHHEPDAALAADHDLVTRRMLDDLELLLDRPHLRFRQTLEELRLFDFDHDRILCALSRPPQGPTRTVPDPRFGEGLAPSALSTSPRSRSMCHSTGRLRRCRRT